MGRSLGWIVFVALAARLLHAAAIVDSPFVRWPIIDAAVYLDWAVSIARGRAPFADEAFYQAPLYPYALAGLFRLVGLRPAAILVAQALVGTATVALVALAAERLLPDRPRLAAAAGWAAALYGPLLYFEGEVLPATIATSLAAAGLLAATLPGAAAAALAGLSFGLGATAFPFVAAGAVGGLLAALRRRERAAAAALLVAFAVPVGLVGARNLEKGATPLVSGNAALNLYIGNDPDDRLVRVRPGPRWERIAAEARARRPHDAGGFFIRETVRRAADRPVATLLGLGRKALEFWNGHERMRNTDPYEARRWSPLLAVLLWERGLSFPFGLVAPLALLGLPRIARRPGGEAAVSLALGVFLLSTLFFVTSRYRLVAVPALLVAAAAGGGALLDAVRRRRAPTLAAAAGLLLVAHAPLAGLRLNEPWTAPYHEALSALRAGDARRAIALLEEARRLDPNAPEPLHYLVALGAVGPPTSPPASADTLPR